MGEKTGIEWTDSTWPIVQGCDYESPGCANCYAVPLIWRLAHNPNQKIAAPLQGLVEKNAAGALHWTGKLALRDDRLTDPLSWKKPRRIFVPSHGDIFHPAVPDEFLDKIFAAMALCPQHTFQVLTKRPERMRDYCASMASRWVLRLSKAINEIGDEAIRAADAPGRSNPQWPLPNVWLGVSAEDQARADERIPLLLETPAAKRFLSCEPLIGPIDLKNITPAGRPMACMLALAGFTWEITQTGTRLTDKHHKIDWVIVGGESGEDARPMLPDWARSLRDQCQAAGVPFFFKQWGEWSPPDYQTVQTLENCDAAGVRSETSARVGKKAAGRVLDGREWSEFPA
jgi:protein gp37